MTVLTNFLQNYRQEEGVFVISEPRSFYHPEDAYDPQYGIDQIDLESYRHEGRVLLDLCNEFGYDSGMPALEIGCGTGRLSLSLAMSGQLGEILITDPSPAFCRITAGKLSDTLPGFTGAKTAILIATDLEKLPKGAFSLIALRSTLHHILDIPRFFHDCAELLAPGGLIVFEEPCYEGYLMMGAMTLFMPDILRGHGVELTAKQLNDVHTFVEAMNFYARRDLDKSACEDKHLFRPDELMCICDDNGLRLELFPNRTFGELHLRNERLSEHYFERFYFDYLKYCMAWDRELLGIFERYAKKYLEYFQPLALGGATPYTYGTFLCKKK